MMSASRHGGKGHTHLVCEWCRYVRKGTHSGGTCPLCRRALVNMGSKFKTPKRDDEKGWTRVRKDARRTRDAVHGYTGRAS